MQRLFRIVAGWTLMVAPAAAQTAAVLVNPSAIGAPVTDQILGMNMANWFDQTQTGIAPAFKQVGIRATRWPGGAISDLFHLATNSDCFPKKNYVNANSTFDNFVRDVVNPAGLDLAVTVNYGSDETCKSPGDPNEAAAWVAYAKQMSIPVSHWTIGNEVYLKQEFDKHAVKHDPVTYAAAVANGYYPAMTAADPDAQIGVVVAARVNPAWDAYVLAHAKYDFVETHWYAQTDPKHVNDDQLLTVLPQQFTAQIAYLKQELAAAGQPSTPIYVGETGSVDYHPGKQTMSITQALFAGQVLGEMMNDGIARATWWLGMGDCNEHAGDFSKKLYGWQSFGGYMVFSDGLPEKGCKDENLALGTPLPTARAFQLMALVAHDGESTLGLSLGGNSQDLRAYALTQAGGTALVLFNLNETQSLPVTISVTGVTTSSDVLIDSYDKAIYDLTKKGIWNGPQETDLGSQTLPLALPALTPWSMTVVRLAR